MNLMTMSILRNKRYWTYIALEMVKDKNKEPFEGHLNMGDKIANMSIDNGLICRPLDLLLFYSQFIINKVQIDEMFDSLHNI